MEKVYPRYMNLIQAREYLNVGSHNTLKKFIDDGLKVSTIGGTKRVDKVDADKFMADHKQ